MSRLLLIAINVGAIMSRFCGRCAMLVMAEQGSELGLFGAVEHCGGRRLYADLR